MSGCQHGSTARTQTPLKPLLAAAITVIIVASLTVVPREIALRRIEHARVREQQRAQLSEAAARGDLVRVRALVEIGADINTVYAEQTALARALVEGRWDCADYLISKGARTDLDDPHCAAGNLLNRLAQAPIRGDDGARKQLRLARFLIQQGNDIENQNRFGSRPLHKASYTGAVLLARELVLRGANVNARSKSGGTPLSLAALYGSTSIVEILLDHGADARYRGGPRNHTALQEAEWRRNMKTARVLREFMRSGRRSQSQRS